MTQPAGTEFDPPSILGRPLISIADESAVAPLRTSLLRTAKEAP